MLGMTKQELHFYPRSPCGERLFQCSHGAAPLHISIHALLAESDAGADSKLLKAPRISIHALLAESDFSLNCGAINPIIFLSTLSLRRATLSFDFARRVPGGISIHALLAESDKAKTTQRSV